MNLLDEARQFRKALDNVSAVADDNTAVKNMIVYPVWVAEGYEYKVGERCRYDKLLYKCRQAHTSQDLWTPKDTPALWEVINIEHAGTIEDPIPYNQSMEVFNGLYYLENEILYKCIRDSGQPLYATCASLVGNYFEVVA